MALFGVTLVFFVAFCALMAIAVKLSGKELPGGCGNKPPGAPRCANCPHEQGERRDGAEHNREVTT